MSRGIEYGFDTEGTSYFKPGDLINASDTGELFQIMGPPVFDEESKTMTMPIRTRGHHTEPWREKVFAGPYEEWQAPKPPATDAERLERLTAALEQTARRAYNADSISEYPPAEVLVLLGMTEDDWYEDDE